MASNNTNKNIESYFDENQILYDVFWSQKALHYGFWYENTKDLSEAILNTNRFVVDCLEINPKDVVLDAGCGVGGTSIFIAENIGAKVSGITLSGVQINKAMEGRAKSRESKLLDFSNQDYTKTNFKNETFSKIFGIESICHTRNKIDFLKEAFRLLKPKGKLAVVDAFLVKTDLTKYEKKIFDKFLKGWALVNLSLKDNFYSDLKKAGFKNIIFHDKFKFVKRSSEKIFRLGLVAYPITWLLSILKIIPKSIHENTIACINQKRVVDSNILTYGVFVAEK